MIVDPTEQVGEPGLRIEAVELGGLDQREHRSGAFAAAVGAGEQPSLAADRDAAQCAFGGVAGQADAAVVEKAGTWRGGGRPGMSVTYWTRSGTRSSTSRSATRSSRAQRMPALTDKETRTLIDYARRKFAEELAYVARAANVSRG